MKDFSDVFPKKVNIEQYMNLIDGAQKASNGADGVPRVVVEEFQTHQLAVRAANAVRNFVRANPSYTLRVSCPENGQTIYVFRSSAPRKTRKSKTKPTNPALPNAPAAEDASSTAQ